MITIFCIPKPFIGIDGIHQLNAILSWSFLQPKCEVVLCGDDPSIIKTAQDLNVKCLTGIEYTSYGTPLLNSVFSKIYEFTESQILCYINSDIILLDDFIEAIIRIKMNKYLALGQRTNIEINHLLAFTSPDWRNRLLHLLKNSGKTYSVDGIDYLIFTRNSNLHLVPNFVVGRPRWDNWFVYNARNKGIPVIDITRTCQAIHQNHGYAHVPLGQANSWYGPETISNINLYNQLVGPENHSANIHDSTWILTKNHMIPALGWHYLFRRFQRTVFYRKRLQSIAAISKKLYKWYRVKSIRHS